VQFFPHSCIDSGRLQLFRFELDSFSLPGRTDESSDALAYTLLPTGGLLLAIADGVGSASYGGAAAKLAVQTCVEIGETLDISALFSEVSSKIKASAKNEGGQWSTTLTVCILPGSRAIVGHVGDTRIYHLRGSGLQSRTRDQTEVERLIEDGILSPERARRYPRRNVLLSALSGEGDFNLQRAEFDVLVGDRLLLLSDGVYRQVTKRDIVSLSEAHRQVPAFVNALKGLLMSRGLVDDASVLCVEILA